MLKVSSERRSNDRRILRRPAQILLAGNRSIEVHTLDISAGGMSIIAPSNPNIGITVRIAFEVPHKNQKSHTPCEVNVRVVQSIYAHNENGFRVGLQFLNLDPATSTVIRNYVS